MKTPALLLSCLSCGIYAPGNAAQLSLSINDGATPVADVVAYLLPDDSAQSLPKPRDGQIDQVNRTFVPLISVVQTGTLVRFPNSDNIRHQVYSFSSAKTFNLKLYSGKQADPVLFDKSGIVVLGCNIHDQMVAWVLVVDTPWFGKSDSNGKAILKAVPDGDYTLKLWHPGQRSEFTAEHIHLVGNLERSLNFSAKSAESLTEHMGH